MTDKTTNNPIELNWRIAAPRTDEEQEESLQQYRLSLGQDYDEPCIIADSNIFTNENAETIRYTVKKSGEKFKAYIDGYYIAEGSLKQCIEECEQSEAAG